MRVLAKERLSEFLLSLRQEYEVFVPAKITDISKFVSWDGQMAIELTSNTVLPPKDIFFPQTEKMYDFQAKGKSIEITEMPSKEGQMILFGIRSCDVRSIICLDKVFLTKGFQDEFYQQKRSSTLLMALGCTSPLATCFCESMGLNPLEAEGVDVQIYDLGENWGLKSLTDSGEKLLEQAQDLLVEANAETTITEPQFLQVDVTDISTKLAQLFEHSIWEEISEKCLGCGICTYLCPTCHCFDISGSVKGEQGFKFRCWDCCMFSEYTRMAGGHNPRPGKKERVRNRYLHKLQYFQERYGMLLCTGCGRCLAHCPVGMDITAIIDKVKEADA